VYSGCIKVREPDPIADFLVADVLASEYVAQADLATAEADVAALGMCAAHSAAYISNSLTGQVPHFASSLDLAAQADAATAGSSDPSVE